MGGRKQEKSGNSSGGKTGKRSALPTVILTLILIAGIAILLYPTISNWWNQRHQSRAIASYQEAVADNSAEENEKLYEEAVAYNQAIAEKGIDLSLGQKDDSDPEKAEYLKTLDVTGTGIMGYITVPKVSIELPIYHDTTESVLQVAVGHMAGSSLPVGGKNTHSVLTGHTGLPSARLFTDIDQLEEGDIFQITVLDHLMTYEVDDIKTVLPDEVGSLQIEEGKDLVTLITCTPYGINTHRLLVTGHRIPNPQNAEAVAGEDPRLKMLKRILPVVIAAVIVAGVIIVKRHRKKRRQKAG